MRPEMYDMIAASHARCIGAIALCCRIDRKVRRAEAVWQHNAGWHLGSWEMYFVADKRRLTRRQGPGHYPECSPPGERQSIGAARRNANALAEVLARL